VTAAAGVGLLVVTAWSVFTGSASVEAGSAAVNVHETLWPAWIGLALAFVVAAGTLLPLVHPAKPAEPKPEELEHWPFRPAHPGAH
jgi:hypothetical protein